jgi:hypothetical protein
MTDFKKGMTVICTTANFKVSTAQSKAKPNTPNYLPFSNKDVKSGKIKVPVFRQKLTIRDVVMVGDKVGLLFEEIVNPVFEYNQIDGKEVKPFEQEVLFNSINFAIFTSRLVQKQ